MKKLIAISLLSMLLVSGCTNPLQNETEMIETEATEVPMPEVVGDTYQSITYYDKTITYTVSGQEVFAPATDSTIVVHENNMSFNTASIELLYMPNYTRLDGELDGVYMRGFEDGYCVIVTDNGVGEVMCKRILDNVTEG